MMLALDDTDQSGLLKGAISTNAQRNHPTEEHLLPLFVALGAAGPNAAAERIHSSTTYGVLRKDAYAFGPKPGQIKNEGEHHA